MGDRERRHIEKIRSEFEATERIRDNLNNSIKILANDLYSKETHFILELIQNAEDNTYEEPEPSLSFWLAKKDPTRTQSANGALIIQNNETGFCRDNVNAICSVGMSTKKKIQGYIGEKGIGFKSVFRVTNTPYIFSNCYHFCLPQHDQETGLGFIVPRWVEETPDQIDLGKTTIILPLNKKDFGYEKIEEMLREIEPETILFLSKLKEIQIKTDSDDDLTILKDTSELPQVQIIVEGKKQEEVISRTEEYLLYSDSFDRPSDTTHEKREGIDTRDVSIAFPVNEENNKSGMIFAYLPVCSGTGLPFLVNADFILTSSREDIHDVPWNHWLFDCVSLLVSDALPRLRDKGILTISFLSSLVNWLTSSSNTMYLQIHKAVERTLSEEKLLPAEDGNYVLAKNAKLAGAEWIRNLLNKKKLKELFESQSPLGWISSNITARSNPGLFRYLRVYLGVDEVTPDSFSRKVTESFFKKQTDDWMIKLYGQLRDQEALWSESGPLRAKPFIRLQNGSHVLPFCDDSPNAYLPTQYETEFAMVKEEIASDEDTIGFLKKLGLAEPDPIAEVLSKVLPKYDGNNAEILEEEYIKDLKMIAFAYGNDSVTVERKNALIKKLKETPFLRSKNAASPDTIEYKTPRDVYLPSEELLFYFKGEETAWFLTDGNGEIELFSDQENLGLMKELFPDTSPRVYTEHFNYTDEPIISQTYTDGLTYDYKIHGLENALNRMASETELLKYTWELLVKYVEENRIKFKGTLRGCRNRLWPEDQILSKEVTTTILRLLTSHSWVPGKSGKLFKPEEITLDDLPEGYEKHERLSQEIGMKSSALAKLAMESGVPLDVMEFAKDNPEEIKKLMANRSAATAKPEFPSSPVGDPGRREERLQGQGGMAVPRQYEDKKQSTRVSKPGESKTWLKNLYTNFDDQMVCQICKDKMPFKKRDGEYYFEAKEIFIREMLSGEKKEYFLALCPNCSAMYTEFVIHEKNAMESLKQDILQSQNQLEFNINLGKIENSIRFVESHIFDLRTHLNQ